MRSNKNEIDISIIIPCYNQGSFLKESIGSIEKLKGEKLNLEIIIVNDGSTDPETLKILGSGEMLSYKIIHQPNKGLSGARNTGLKNARGTYIQFLDADDIIINDKFSTQLNFFKNDRDLGVCISDFLCSRENIKETYRDLGALVFSETSFPINDFLFRWERGFTVPIHCALLRKEICLAVGGFDESLRSKEDWNFWAKLALAGVKFKFHDDVMAIYRIHRNSMCRDVRQSILGYMGSQAKISNLVGDESLRNKFIEKSIEHLDVYLEMYRNQILLNSNLDISKLVVVKLKDRLRKIKYIYKMYCVLNKLKNKIVGA